MTLESDIEFIVESLNEQAIPIMAKRLAVSFAVGWKLGGSKARLTDVQKKAIATLSKTQIGYLAEFHRSIGDTLLDNVKANLAEGGGYKSAKGEIKPIVESVFGKDGKVIIDRTGQTRKVTEVLKDGSLRLVDKKITQPYYSTVQNYSDMLSRTSVHSALSRGRIESYKARNINKVRYISVLDSRTRPEHMALSGRVFETDSEDMETVQSLLSSPHCRCRLIPYFDDPDLDTPDEHFKSDRERVFFDSETNTWAFKNPIE